jgi:dihydrofolate reductase
MRKIVVTEFLSLDGVMEDPHLWHFPFFDDAAGIYKLDEVMNSDALLLGRVTYEGFAAAWPERGEDMAGKPEPTDATDENVFTNRFNWMPKYVVSDSLSESEASWNNSHIIRGADMVDTLTALKQEDGKDLYIHGSGKLIQSLIPTGLIDEYHLMVHPIVVGKGQRLFPDGVDPVTLKLLDTRSYDKGIVVLVYAPAEADTSDQAS